MNKISSIIFIAFAIFVAAKISWKAYYHNVELPQQRQEMEERQALLEPAWRATIDRMKADAEQELRRIEGDQPSPAKPSPNNQPLLDGIEYEVIDGEMYTWCYANGRKVPMANCQ